MPSKTVTQVSGKDMLRSYDSKRCWLWKTLGHNYVPEDLEAEEQTSLNYYMKDSRKTEMKLIK